MTAPEPRGCPCWSMAETVVSEILRDRERPDLALLDWREIGCQCAPAAVSVAERMLAWLEGRNEYGMMDDSTRWFLDECEAKLRELMAESDTSPAG